MSANLLYLIDSSILLLIGLISAFVPYITPPFIQFGVRVTDSMYSERKLVNLRRTYSVTSFSLALILALIVYFLGRILPGYFFTIGFILIYLLMVFVLYLSIHYTVLKMKKTLSNQKPQNEIVSTSLTDENLRVNPLVFILPWVALGLILATGLYLYPSLPSTFPTHYNANGVANAFTTKSYFSVFFLILIVGIPLNAILDILAIATLRVGQIMDPSRPIGSKFSIKRFNLVNSYFIVGIAIMVDIIFFMVSLVEWQIIPASLITVVTLVPVFLIFAIILVVMLKLGQGGWKTMGKVSDSGSGKVSRDDDSLWKAGVIYYNPDDSAILVPKRFGYGYTINMAHPVSWLFIIVLIIVVVTVLLLATGF